MARNRRRVEGEVTFTWIITRLLLFVVLVGCLLGILYFKRDCLKIGDELSGLSRELETWQQKTKSLEVQLAHYKTPRELENKLAYWRIEMIRPNENQIRRFREQDVQQEKIIRPRLLVQANPVRLTPRAP